MLIKSENSSKLKGNPEEPYTILPDMYVDNSIATTQLRNIGNVLDPWSQCFKTCNQHPNCHFVEFKSTNSCILYDKSAHFALISSAESSSKIILFHRKKYEKAYAEGLALRGSFLKHLNQSSEDTCWDECLRSKSCAVVSFNMSNSSCYLFKKGGYKVLDDAEFISIGFESEELKAVKPNSTNAYWFVQLSQGWAKTSNERSRDECWEKCVKTTGCFAISFNVVSSTCTLIEVDTYTAQFNRDYVSMGFANKHDILKNKIDFNNRYG